MKRQRRYGLDTLRGVTLLSMMVYHACWDLVYIFGKDWEWYRSDGAYLWQQSICWTFILLSGYCWNLSRDPLRRGFSVFGGGVVISVVTTLLMPENRVFFGVLSLLGTAMLLLIPLQGVLRRISPKPGLVVSFSLFLLLGEVNAGYLGFEGVRVLRLPAWLYRNDWTACLGFPPPAFYSTDYFPIFPWFFLFLTGYFLYQLRSDETIPGLRLPLVTALGRHSLLVYLLHQPVIFGVLYLMYV